MEGKGNNWGGRRIGGGGRCVGGKHLTLQEASEAARRKFKKEAHLKKLIRIGNEKTQGIFQIQTGVAKK